MTEHVLSLIYATCSKKKMAARYRGRIMCISRRAINTTTRIAFLGAPDVDAYQRRFAFLQTRNSLNSDSYATTGPFVNVQEKCLQAALASAKQLS